MQNLFPRIMGFIVIVITLALAPTINTANTAITSHANVSIMTGMAAIGAFGAPLIILGLLTVGGIFAISGVKGQLSAGVGDMMKVIGSVVIIIVSLTLMTTVMDYVYTLYAASSGFALVIYALIPLVIYVGIIVQSGWVSVHTYRKGRKKGGKKSKTFV